MDANVRYIADAESILYAVEFCRDIQAVNDCADRAIQDIRDPADHNEVILVANDHRNCQI